MSGTKCFRRTQYADAQVEDESVTVISKVEIEDGLTVDYITALSLKL